MGQVIGDPGGENFPHLDPNPNIPQPHLVTEVTADKKPEFALGTAQFKQNSDLIPAIFASSKQNDAIVAVSDTKSGVLGMGGTGIVGWGDGVGVQGYSQAGDAVVGESQNGIGVVGKSRTNGVLGVTMSSNHAAVWGRNDGNGVGVFGGSPGGIGVVGSSENGLAGRFIGDVEVTGDIRLANADCAEDFDIADGDRIEPGTVMVLGDEGALYQSHLPYDKRVAGVISGAGDYKPGIVLDKRQSQCNRQPVALLGKVYCKVDAQYGSVEVGDLLTTSATPGHAMKVGEPLQALGSVIGKALRPLKVGQGLIPILIALQ